MNSNKGKKIVLVILMLLAVVVIALMLTYALSSKPNSNDEDNKLPIENVNNDNEEQDTPNDFALKFLKLENEKENKVYSPLSIKYALKMLEEAANGESKSQISNLLGDATLTKYTSSKNLSIANALFIKDTFKDSVKESYVTTLKNNYDADIKYDTLKTAKAINEWIKEKTFEIIPEILSDDDVSSLDYALVNTVAIDMEWQNKFLTRWLEGDYPSIGQIYTNHERGDGEHYIDVDLPERVTENEFEGNNGKIQVAGMEISASINNYDIINELGEENIKQIVTDDYTEFAKDPSNSWRLLSEDTSDKGIKKALDEYLPKYIEELKENYHSYGASTEFSFYVDDDVKVFAKNLKEYDGTKLQYIGIMPTQVELNTFVEGIDTATINKYISSLKTIATENFKEGVLTKIEGFIPKFDFEYDLNLLEDLNICNITDVFDKEKADLSNLTSELGAYISNAAHKAKIEFTEDGIKAAAVTVLGGMGAGEPYDYIFEIPVEFIDLTFDKPYMFLIRDTETNELLFVGTVYEPLLWENEPSKDVPSAT